MQFYKLCQCYVKSLHICMIILKLTETPKQVHIISRKIPEWHITFSKSELGKKYLNFL